MRKRACYRLSAAVSRPLLKESVFSMSTPRLASRYRSHTLGALRPPDAGQSVRLSGWVFRRRDHGSLLFLDLRDHYGTTQCVLDPADCPAEVFAQAQGIRVESVVALRGTVRTRASEAVNDKVETGGIEVAVEHIEVLSEAAVLPFPIEGSQEPPEEQRLRHRFLDLRRESVHHNIALRARIIASLRRRMHEAGFLEYATPILTSSSPEGARDYLVPSRLHPGKFYALPQAPQQFKQLLMVSGFDRYFQVAPCFRDEDARADRSPGEFYQLDIEMSFVEQEDIFATIEPVLRSVYQEFAPAHMQVDAGPFLRMPWAEAMACYGSDKPDLRNPLRYETVSDLFAHSGFSAFAKAVGDGAVVRALRIPQGASQSRSFFDKAQALVRAEGLPGLGYITLTADGEAKGPIAKFLSAEEIQSLQATCGAQTGDAIAFLCGQAGTLYRPADKLRQSLGESLNLIEKDCFRFLWVVDFPFFEWDEEKKAIAFSHNPFSMPQGGLEALETQDPLTIKAYQYDIVCNGIELSSGAIRNHRPEIMLKAFAMAGYSATEVEEQFGGMMDAFRFGAPPHGGLAPGIDRMVMQLAGEQNIREVIAFPMTQQAQDLLMHAPAPVSDRQLRELHIGLQLPKPDDKKR